jgi:hypothetical protein
VELELLPYQRPDVRGVLDGLEEAGKLEELGVGSVVKPGLDGNAVVKLVTKGMGRVVHQHSLGEVTTQNSQVLIRSKKEKKAKKR